MPDDALAKLQVMIEEIKRKTFDIQQKLSWLEEFKEYCRIMDWRFRAVFLLIVVVVIFVRGFSNDQ